MAHNIPIPDDLPYLSTSDLATMGKTMRMFPMTTVADHANYFTNRVPKLEDMPHELGELFDRVERHHVREYTRLFADRMAAIEPLPMVITGGSAVSDMIRRQVARFRDHEEAMILSMFHDTPSQPKPFDWPTWEAKPLAGHELKSVLFDEMDFAIDPTPKWTEALAGLQTEGKTLTNFMAAAKAIQDAIPPDFTPPPRPVDNRAARRAERAKKRKNHA